VTCLQHDFIEVGDFFFLLFPFLFLLDFWLLVEILSPKEGEGEGVDFVDVESEGSTSIRCP
jgi:hypothetical protein